MELSIKDGIVGAMIVGGGSGNAPVTSDTIWRPSVEESGDLSWSRSNATTPPETVNIKGPAGPQGQQGAPGATGPAGPQGEQGPQGPTGPTGQQGPTGEQGPAGEQGPEGPQGPQGVQGEKGDQGTPFLISKIYANITEMNEGYATDGLQEGQLVAIATDTGGEQGGYIYAKGPTQYDFFYDISTTDGIQGPQGPQGEQGPQGPAGPAGATGATGPVGPQGPEGPQGEKGDTGEQGPQGPAGQAATIQVGTVTTGAPGSNPDVKNSGTSTEAVFDFTFPPMEGGTGAPFNSVSITLTAAGWTGDNAPYEQTVSMANVSADSPVIVSPADTASRANAGAAGVMLQAIGAGTLTFICTTKPTADLNYNAGILTGGGDGGGTAGVRSFNDRTGAVMPQAGDYTATQVGARPDNWMPTAGDGIVVSGETMSARISPEADNATGILNGALYTAIPRPSAVYPLVEVTTIPATASVQVTATKGELSAQGTTDENGKVDIELTAFGVWTFAATIGGEQAAADIAVSASQLYSLTLSTVNVFGVAWDKTNPSTQLTRLTPTTDPNGLVTVAITTEPQPAVGTGSGYSPFDRYAPWSGMYVCNLSADGAETAKQGDPEFSYSTADVMVYVPEFYCKIIETNSVRYFYVSDKALSGFIQHPGSNAYIGRYETAPDWHSIAGSTPATSISMQTARENSVNKGTGWGAVDFKTLCAIQLLFLIEFADWNSQAVIGAGISNSSIQANGQTDSMEYHTGRVAGADVASAIQYRGIENVWGNVWTYVDGYTGYNQIAHICINPSNYASNTDENYTNLEISVPSRGYTSSLGYNEEYSWAFIPDRNGGTGSTYIPDLVWSVSGWTALGAGGDYEYGDQCGMFAFANNTNGTAAPNVGCRLVYHPQEVIA